jgi:hypothetical protein
MAPAISARPVNVTQNPGLPKRRNHPHKIGAQAEEVRSPVEEENGSHTRAQCRGQGGEVVSPKLERSGKTSKQVTATSVINGAMTAA